MAGSTASREGLGAEIAQRDQRRVHHAGHQRRQNAGHRHPVLQTVRRGRVARSHPACSLWLRKKSAVASFGMVPTPAMAYTLPSLVRTRMGDSPPSPKCENSRHRGRQHGGDSGIHGVAAGDEHAHAGFGGVLGSRRHCAMRTSGRQAHGPVRRLTLRPSCRNHRRQNYRQSKFHHDCYIVACSAGKLAWCGRPVQNMPDCLA